MKKLLSIVLCFSLLLTFLPALTPSAYAESCPDHNYVYWPEGAKDDWDHQVICHACLDWQWEGHEYDSLDDLVCNICDYQACEGHAFTGENYTNYINNTEDETYHYLQCDYCPRYIESAAEEHSYDGEDDYFCNVCYYCRCTHEGETVWDGVTWDDVDHWSCCTVCNEYIWESHLDEDDDAHCDVCDFTLNDCDHENSEIGYDDAQHYLWCIDCEQRVVNYSHLFEYEINENQHRCYCEECGYPGEELWEPHVDDDGDHYCDVCDGKIVTWISLTLALEAVDENGDVVPGALDAQLNEDGWVSNIEPLEREVFFAEPNVLDFNENSYLPDGYLLPEDIVFTADQAGNLTVTDGNARVEVRDGIYYFIVPMQKCLAHISEDGDHYCDICGEEIVTWISLTLALEAVDENGDVMDEDLDACLNEREWVSNIEPLEREVFFAKPNVLDFNENSYLPEGYLLPEDITFTSDQQGNLTVTDGNARVEVRDEVYYFIVPMQECPAHISEDADHICDICGGRAWNLCSDENNDHFCDNSTCAEHLSERCTEGSYIDHLCDICSYRLVDLCVNQNDDHACDICDAWFYELCTDEDTNHICDNANCARYMKELCMDENDDLICDICNQSTCYHYVDSDSAESNGDGTHSGLCLSCGSWQTVSCSGDYYELEDKTHCISCGCGYVLLDGVHTYEEAYNSAHSVAGHWVMCDVCDFEKLEPHRFGQSVCEVCDRPKERRYDVYVGGVGLMNGQYLDNTGARSETKPAGGYAYYHNGTLELNNFSYAGEGMLWMEDVYSQSVNYACMFSTVDLTLQLTGENSLTNTLEIEDAVYGDAIATVGDLTICGEGSLILACGDDGINANSCDVILRSGSVQIGDAAASRSVGDDGIDVDAGSLYIQGGNLSVCAADHGFDVSKDITVTGGKVDVQAGDDGFDASKNILISGGKIRIRAADYGLDSSNSIAISGGTLDIEVQNYDGISTEKDVSISGGRITIQGAEAGIYAGSISVTDGDLDIRGGSYPAMMSRLGSIIVRGGNLELTSVEDVAVFAYGGLELPEYAVVTDHRASIVTPFETQVVDGEIQLSRIPWNLEQVLVAAYDADGRLTNLQWVTVTTDTVRVAVDGAEVSAYFMDADSTPIAGALDVK